MLYEIPSIEHLTARTVGQATQWLAEYGARAKLVAGGTDLLGLMKDKIAGPQMAIPEILIDIKKIAGLASIQYRKDEGLTIGSAATLTSIMKSGVVLEKYPMLAQAAGQVATSQIRNVGTLGGNLCQRPWCWYFRLPQFNCYKKGGPMCPAITGQNKYYFSILGLGICVAAHPSDLAPALIALGASAKIVGKLGIRTVRMEHFFTGPKDVFETVLQPDEILTEIQVPEPLPISYGIYLKERPRETWDFALASVAALLQFQDGACRQARIVLGGIAPYPYRAVRSAELLRDREIGGELAEKAGEAAVSAARPLRSNRYKIQLTKALVKRAILRCLEQATTVKAINVST